MMLKIKIRKCEIDKVVNLIIFLVITLWFGPFCSLLIVGIICW